MFEMDRLTVPSSHTTEVTFILCVREQKYFTSATKTKPPFSHATIIAHTTHFDSLRFRQWVPEASKICMENTFKLQITKQTTKKPNAREEKAKIKKWKRNCWESVVCQYVYKTCASLNVEFVHENILSGRCASGLYGTAMAFEYHSCIYCPET